jgi:hypothetical protein
MLRGGAEVFVRDGRLMVRLVTSVPGLHRDFPLQPDDRDPTVFRLDLAAYGMPLVRVAFSRDATGRATAVHTNLGGQPWSLVRAEPARHDRRRAVALAAVGAGVAALLLGRATAGRTNRTRP